MPTFDHVPLRQRVRPTAPTSPAVWKLPPTKSAVPLPSSCTANAHTAESTPAPSGDQLAPFQRASHGAGAPPAVWKLPPA
ncbi:MAG: hypothetical protein IPJ77_15030 [Planctomycetes bacterium]|nr:hypothetical protein [Planctomycetota bacterium]